MMDRNAVYEHVKESAIHGAGADDHNMFQSSSGRQVSTDSMNSNLHHRHHHHQQQSLGGIPFRVYMAKYSYDPVQYSPNDNPDVELMLTAGEYLFIYGDMDEDGFYEGELLDGKRGLVPSNFIEKVPDEDLEDFRYIPVSLQNGTARDAPNNGFNDTNVDTKDVTDSVTSFVATDSETTRQTVTITQLSEAEDVPPPTDLRLDRQLSSSFIIAWSPPEHSDSHAIRAYNIYSNGLFLTTVKADDRTKALLEKLDPNKKHQITVRTVTDRGQSSDFMCTIVIGGDADQVVIPSNLNVTDVTTTSAVVSWIPGNSNLEHIVTVDDNTSVIITRMHYRCLVDGLAPDSEHTVTVYPIEPDKGAAESAAHRSDAANSARITFLTLPEDLPNAPVDVQVDVGPQRGTLLVTWMPPVKLKSDPPSDDASEQTNVITGYTIYVDGTRVKQLDSPTGDHVMLDSHSFASFPADPKLVTVRTSAADRESRDSRPAALTHQLLEEIRTGMMLTECERATCRSGSSPDADPAMSSPSNGAVSTSLPVGDYNGTSTSPKRHHSSGKLHPRSVPHIEITLDSLSGGSSGGDDSDTNVTRRRSAAVSAAGPGSRRRTKEHPSRTQQQQQQQQQPFDVVPTKTRRSPRDSDSAVVSRSADKSPPSARQSTDSSGSPRLPPQATQSGRDERGPPDDGFSGDVLASDPETVDDSLVGDSDENGRGKPRPAQPRRVPSRGHHALPRAGRAASGRVHRQYGGGGAGAASNYRVFIALFDYNPATMSPNRDALDDELPFCEGQLLKIYGPKDGDGFYFGETEGRRGLIPCNMVSEVHVDSPEIAERLLRENPTPPPPGGRDVRGPVRPAPVSRPRDPTRHHRGPPVLHDQRRRVAGPHEPPVVRHRLPARRMVAIYDYNPHELSPNVDAEKELSFKMGDVITVYGDVDYDGFYRGELDGRRGLVPSNFLRSTSAVDDRRQPVPRHHHRYAPGPTGPVVPGGGPVAGGVSSPPRDPGDVDGMPAVTRRSRRGDVDASSTLRDVQVQGPPGSVASSLGAVGRQEDTMESVGERGRGLGGGANDVRMFADSDENQMQLLKHHRRT